MTHECTIILQGVINDNINYIDTIRHYLKYSNVIISSYFQNNEDIEKIKNLFPSVIVINNNLKKFDDDLISMKKKSGYKYCDNCFYQIRTVRASLKYIQTEFTIKSRIDNFFHDIEKFIIMMKSNKDKITSLSLYVRSFSYAKYHLSDILFGGQTNKIKNVIDLSIKNYTVGGPEVVIWKPYILDCVKKNIDNDLEIYVEEMSKLFIIFPLNHMSNYNFKGIKHFSDTPKSTEDYFRLGFG